MIWEQNVVRLPRFWILGQAFSQLITTKGLVSEESLTLCRWGSEAKIWFYIN